MRPHRPHRGAPRPPAGWLVACLLLLVAPAAWAQLPGLDPAAPDGPDADPPPAAPADSEQTQEERLRAEAAAAASGEAAARQRRSDESAFLEAAPQRIQEEEALLRAARERPVAPDDAALAALPPAQVRKQLAEKEVAVASNRSHALTAQAELDRLNRRLDDLPAETQEARDRVEQARLLLDDAAEEAERALREAQLQAATSRLELLTEEATSLPLREQLTRTRIDRLRVQGERLAEELGRLNARDAQIRQREARDQSRAAREAVVDAEGLPEAAQRLAARLLELTARREQIEREAAGFTGQLAEVNAERDLYRQQLASARSRVEVGMTEAVGVQFQARRRELRDPGPAALRRQIRELDGRLAAYSTTLLDLADDQRSLSGELAVARAALGSPPDPAAAARLDRLEETHAEVVEAATEAAEQAYSDALNLSIAQKSRLAALEEYAGFLDERLLWTPDLGRLAPSDLTRSWTAFWRWWGRLDAPEALRGVAAALSPPPLLESLVALLGLVLLGSRARLRRRIAELGEPVGTLARDRFELTVKGFGATVMVALPLPLLLLGLGRALAPGGGVVGQLGAALIGSSLVLFPVLLVRVICRADGLAPVHFLWPEAGCRALRSTILRLGLLLVAFRFVSSFLAPDGGPAALVGPGFAGAPAGGAEAEAVDLRLIHRLFLIVTLAGVSVFMARTFRRNGELGAQVWQDARRPLARFHRLWYPVLVGVPLAVAALAGMGYFFTALALEGRLLWTVWVITAVVIAYAMALRWLRLTHRQLMYAELLKKREAQKAAAAAAAEDLRKKKEAARAARRAGGIEGDDDEDETDEGEDDAREQLTAIAEQAVEGDTQLTPFSLNEKTGKLINLGGGLALLAGLWFVWSGILPALEFLNTVKLPLLTQTVTVNNVEDEVPVTLGQLFLCLGLLALTFTAGRHLPGLLDLLVLTRFKVQAGTRYAATMLTQYVIVAAGLLLALSALGLGWGRLQWLVAALSVGLGFGLQEIFANFVSGLIILFERPIRVGDTVSIGETTGVVTRIRIRATTITDLDLRELIVPNKEFITGKLINWSLSNPVIRLTIPVGIAYGGDTRLAQKLLIQAARKHRDVLNEPAASALFMGFGDNTLNFELRIFVKEVLRRFQILSELNLAIDDAFKDAGIVIAFPQRDVHLDTPEPLEVVVKRAGAEG